MDNDAQEVLDLMAYIKVYAPHFPEEDQTSTTEAFERLKALLRRVHGKVKKGHGRWWVELCLRESEQSRVAYESGQDNDGLRFLDSVEDYFGNYLEGKRLDTSFIAGPDGTERVKE